MIEPLTETEIAIINGYAKSLSDLFHKKIEYVNANFISKYFIKKRMNVLMENVEYYKNLIEKLGL